MTPEIKQRIEQIRQGEIPKGYQWTKAGICPQTWHITRFQNLFTRINRRNTIGNTNVLTISAQHGLIRQEEFFSKSIASIDKSNYYLLYKGDFAYNKSYSNGYPFGAIKQLELYDCGIVSPLYICFTPTKANPCPAFYRQYFQAGKMNREIQAYAQEGARNHGLLNISVDDFFHSILLQPPIEEQEKIADILCTQDQVLERKEMLLKESRRKKQYLMQTLVTGKIRLPGFSKKWEPSKLGTLLHERKLYAQKGLAYPHVTLSTDGISPKTERYNRDHLVKSEEKEYKVTRKGDICYNPANLKFGVICENKFGDAIFSPIYVTFEVTDHICREYLANYLMRWDFINAVRKYEEGTVYERMAVKPEDFLKFEILLPPLDEQIAIAEVLSAADREIDLLQRDLEQEKQQKKALAQLLLSGIVRVTT